MRATTRSKIHFKIIFFKFNFSLKGLRGSRSLKGLRQQSCSLKGEGSKSCCLKSLMGLGQHSCSLKCSKGLMCSRGFYSNSQTSQTFRTSRTSLNIPFGNHSNLSNFSNLSQPHFCSFAYLLPVKSLFLSEVIILRMPAESLRQSTHI